MILLEYQYKKIFLQNFTLQIGLKKFLWLKKLRILCRGHIINNLSGDEIVVIFYKNELEITNRKEFRMEKVIRKKDDKLYVKWKGYNNSFNGWIYKRDSVNERIFSKTEIFSSKCESWIRFIYYTTKADLKNATSVDTSDFARKNDFTNLKSDVDK